MHMTILRIYLIKIFSILVLTVLPFISYSNTPCTATAMSVNTTCSLSGIPTKVTVDPGGCVSGNFGYGTWLSAIVPTTGAIEVRALSSSFTNAGVAAYTGTCGSLIQIACNNNWTLGATLTTGVIASGVPGSTMWLYVWSANSFNVGDYTKICLQESIALPIKLLSFNAALGNSGDVNLDWVTTTEINNEYFTIERSIDAINWGKVVKVSGAGNSSQIINYKALDDNPYLGRSYYRLKQSDFDGSYSYSNVVPVLLEPSKEIIVSPNPFKNKLSIDFGYLTVTDYIVEITNRLGQKIIKQIIPKGSFEKEIKLNCKLKNGIYIIHIYSEEKSFVKKIMKF